MTVKPLLGAMFAVAMAGSLSAQAATDKPNILLILADDLGYSDLGSFGGEIETPSIDGLADEGLKLTNMYAAASCSPTRSMLMSGTDNHLAGLGTMAEALPHEPFHQGKPGYEGYLNEKAYSVAELLQDAGYSTNMVGKWHLGKGADQGPDARGFERSFALFEGGAVHFKPNTDNPSRLDKVTYRENGEAVELPDDFYSSDFYTDKLIDYLKANEGSGKPFFAYAAYTSPHWPLQAPDAYLDKYKGVYDGGYAEVRDARIKRMKELGLYPEDMQPANRIPGNPKLPRWEQLDEEQRQYQARLMEVYAAMVDNLDDNVGRVIDYLKESGQYDNTMILFMSDNGASGDNHTRFYPHGPDTDNSLDNLGRVNSQVDYGIRWAEVSSGPLNKFKITSFEGGISVPAIVRLPEGMSRTGLVNTRMRVDDLSPTFLELSGTPLPGDSYKGQTKHPITGQSMLPALLGKTDDAGAKSEMAGELFGNLYYHEGDLKLVGYRDRRTKEMNWELYDLSVDRGETNDLSDSQPETLERLKKAWMEYADRVGVVRRPE